MGLLIIAKMSVMKKETKCLTINVTVCVSKL